MKRSTRFRLSLSFVLLLLAPGFGVLPPPEARAGLCVGGQRAKYRYLFERLEYLTASVLKNTSERARHNINRIRVYVPRFSLWILHWQSRSVLTGFLLDAVQNPDNQLDIKQLRSSMAPLWKQAAAILKHFLQVDIDPVPLLDSTVRDTAAHWFACRAVKSARSAPCDQLESIHPDLKQDCLNLLFRFGILYSGRCSDKEGLKLAATLIGTTPENAQKLCQIVKDQQSEKCRLLIQTLLAQQICLALTGQGAAACDEQSLPEKGKSECLREYRAFEAAKRAGSTALFEQSGPDPMLRAAVYAARGTRGCMDIVMQLYDRQDRSRADFFQLDGEWYQPPGIR